MVFWHYCRANMSDMAPWQNKVASCWHLQRKFYRKNNIWKVVNWNVCKKLEMSFCALVEVECIMALYNKGRQTVLLSISTSTNGDPAWSKSESKANIFNSSISEATGDLSIIWAWTLLDLPVSLGGPFGLCQRARWERRLQCVTGYGGIKMTESRRPFTLTPDSRHPVCAHTLPHIHTHSSLATHALVHMLYFTLTSTHTQANKNTIRTTRWSI